MEDSLIYFILDLKDEWNIWEKNEREAFALQTLQEWICSDSFKVKATHREVDSGTFLGQAFLNCQREDQYWKSEEYRRVKELRNNVYECWKEQNWIYLEERKQGRPRRAEYSTEVLSKARNCLNPPFVLMDSEEDTTYRNTYWKKSILGEHSIKTWIYVVVVKDSLFEEIYKKAGAEYITGLTKEEIAEKLKLPKKFVNEMCRWLIETGKWKMADRKVNGKHRREIRLLSL